MENSNLFLLVQHVAVCLVVITKPKDIEAGKEWPHLSVVKCTDEGALQSADNPAHTQSDIVVVVREECGPVKGCH